MSIQTTIVCGVDEAGRGPLAGPVYAAAVILGAGVRLRGLADSKMLTPDARESLRVRIERRAVAWAVASASVEEIDGLNILQATLLAMRRAVEQLTCLPAQVLVDGLHCPPLNCPVRPVVRGDATVKEISAASILAKTARDRYMVDLDSVYPQYGFAQHKGYSTPEHLDALRRHGACPHHRQTFAPVREVLYSLF
ncbi:MAG: ribonuclease HII [Betaproteobacteria bacterium]|nr:ribonuclease HII [Betaproteobacteria bacterium]